MAIKNVGSGPVGHIIKAREEGGRFESLADFVSRVDLHALNKRALESMIAAGAFDSVHPNRRAMNEVLESMIAFGHTIQETSHTVDMFGGGTEDMTRKAPELPAVEDWAVSVKLNNEKEMLGFYVSGHPLARYRRELKQFAGISTGKIESIDDGREVRVGGIIQAIKIMLDKRGNQMAFVTIEDFAGSLELIVFSDCYEKAKSFLRVDGIIMASGRVSTREGQAAKLIASNLLPLDRLSEYVNCRLVLNVNKADYGRISEWWNVLEANRGDKEIIVLARNNGEEIQIRPKHLRVRLDSQVIDSLKEMLGESRVYLAPAGNGS